MSTNSFASKYNQVYSDVVLVERAAKQKNLKQLETVCGGFAEDSGTAYTILPSPDQTLTDDLNTADIDFVSASTTCGSYSLTHAGVEKALAKISEGVAALISAQARLKVLGLDWGTRL